MPKLIFSTRTKKKHFYGDSNPGHFLRDLAFFPAVSLLKQILLVLCVFLHRHHFPGYIKHLYWESSPGQFFEIVAFVPAENFFLYLTLFSELQEPPSPGLELRTIFQSFDLSKMSSCCLGINIQSLVRFPYSLSNCK